MDSVPGSPSGGQLRRTLGVFRKWRFLIALVVLASVGGGGYLYKYGEPNNFMATATLNVIQSAGGQQQAQSTTLQGVVQSESTLPATMETDAWQVTDPAVLASAAQSLKSQGISLTVQDLRGMVTSKVQPGTDLIQVNVTSHSAKESAVVANAVASASLQAIQSQDRAKLGQAVTFLQQQAQTIGTELSQATTELAKAEATAGVTPQSQARITADQQQISALKGQLVQAQVTLRSDQAGLQSVQSQLATTPRTVKAQQADAALLSNQPTPNPLYTSIESQIGAEKVKIAQEQAAIKNLQSTIQSLQANAYALSQAGGNQELVNLNGQLLDAQIALSGAKAAETSLNGQLSQVPADLKPLAAAGPTQVPNVSYEALQTKASSLQTSVAQDQATVSELTHALNSVQADASNLAHPSAASEANIQTLQTRIAQLTQTYKTLSAGLTQSQITNLALQGSAVVALAAQAVPPAAPLHKSRKLLILAVVGGLIVGIGLVLFLEQLDVLVRTPEDVERLTALPTLGIIPHVGR